MVRTGAGRAVQGDDVGPRNQFIECLDIGRRKYPFDRFGQPLAVVINDLQPKGARPVRHRLANPPHTHNPEYLAAELSPEK